MSCPSRRITSYNVCYTKLLREPVAEPEQVAADEQEALLFEEPSPGERESATEAFAGEPEPVVVEALEPVQAPALELEEGEPIATEPPEEESVESAREELHEAPATVDEQLPGFIIEEEAAAAPTEEPAGDEAEDDGKRIVPAAPLAEKTQEKPASRSLFKRLRDRLGKTRDAFVYRLDQLFLGKKEIDQDLFEQLEEILITADLGVSTTLELMDRARKKVKREQLSDPQALKTIIREEILGYIEASEKPAELVMPEDGPFVIMVVGVNGVGKTTTIGKVAAKFVRSGQSVLLVAADTFRAAAINQLRIWGERA